MAYLLSITLRIKQGQKRNPQEKCVPTKKKKAVLVLSVLTSKDIQYIFWGKDFENSAYSVIVHDKRKICM